MGLYKRKVPAVINRSACIAATADRPVKAHNSGNVTIFSVDLSLSALMLPAGSERMKMLSIIHRSIVWPPWASFPSSTSFISFLVGGDISLMPYPKGTAVKSMLSRFCTICTAFQLSKEISRMLNLSPSRSMIFSYSRNSPHFLPWSLERHDAPTDYIEHGCAVHGGQMFLTVSRNRVRHNIYPHHPEMGILVQKS